MTGQISLFGTQFIQNLFFTQSPSSSSTNLLPFNILSPVPILCIVLLLSGTEEPTPPLPNRQDEKQTRERHMACHTHITLSLSTLSVNIFNWCNENEFIFFLVSDASCYLSSLQELMVITFSYDILKYKRPMEHKDSFLLFQEGREHTCKYVHDACHKTNQTTKHTCHTTCSIASLKMTAHCELILCAFSNKTSNSFCIFMRKVNVLAWLIMIKSERCNSVSI